VLDVRETSNSMLGDNPARTNFVVATRDSSELRPQLLRLRRPLYHPDFPFIILWSQKAACTTVVKWFFLQVGLLDEAQKYHSWVHRYEGDVFKNRPTYIEDMYEAVKNGKPIVKFVRDPYTRAYSSYLSVCSAQSIGSDGHWTISSRQQIAGDLAGSASATEYAFSFRQFLQWLAAQRGNKVNPHIRMQHAPRDEYLSYRYYKIEKLADNFRILEQEFNLPHSVSDHADILESGHFHKKAEFDLQTARALLDLAVPVQRSNDFPYVSFDREIARGTDYDRLIRECFYRDLKRYDYLDALEEQEMPALPRRKLHAAGHDE